MSNALQTIRKEVGTDALSKSCKRFGCKVSLECMPSHRIVIDVDKAYSTDVAQHSRCDYVLFFARRVGDGVLAIPIELKSGNVDASEASKQLQWGLEIVDRLVPRDSDTECYPILFHGKSLHPKQRKSLNRTKISYRGRKLTILTGRCNRPGNLAVVLGKEVTDALKA